MTSKKYLMILSILVILVLPIALAQEEAPKYNFGSMQPAKEFSVSAGDVIITKLYFYNIYGNKITHISLSAEAPKNWVVTMDPPLHNTTVSIGGITTTVTENLYVEPSNATDTIPEVIPEGIEYISSSVGYIGANPVIIKIKIPADEQVGKVDTVTITGVAEWLGQGGAAAIKQSRNFDYTVKVVGEGLVEEIIGEVPKEEAVPQEVPTLPEAEKEVEEQPTSITGFFAYPVLAGIGTGVIIAVIAIFIMRQKTKPRWTR